MGRPLMVPSWLVEKFEDLCKAVGTGQMSLFDEAKVSRHGKGSSKGGQFAPKGGVKAPTNLFGEPEKPAPQAPEAPARKRRSRRASRPMGNAAHEPIMTADGKGTVVWKVTEGGPMGILGFSGERRRVTTLNMGVQVGDQVYTSGGSGRDEVVSAEGWRPVTPVWLHDNPQSENNVRSWQRDDRHTRAADSTTAEESSEGEASGPPELPEWAAPAKGAPTGEQLVEGILAAGATRTETPTSTSAFLMPDGSFINCLGPTGNSIHHDYVLKTVFRRLGDYDTAEDGTGRSKFALRTGGMRVYITIGTPDAPVDVSVDYIDAGRPATAAQVSAIKRLMKDCERVTISRDIVGPPKTKGDQMVSSRTVGSNVTVRPQRAIADGVAMLTRDVRNPDGTFNTDFSDLSSKPHVFDRTPAKDLRKSLFAAMARLRKAAGQLSLFDESAHPRHSKGPKGGQFAPKGGGKTGGGGKPGRLFEASDLPKRRNLKHEALLKQREEEKAAWGEVASCSCGYTQLWANPLTGEALLMRPSVAYDPPARDRTTQCPRCRDQEDDLKAQWEAAGKPAGKPEGGAEAPAQTTDEPQAPEEAEEPDPYRAREVAHTGTQEGILAGLRAMFEGDLGYRDGGHWWVEAIAADHFGGDEDAALEVLHQMEEDDLVWDVYKGRAWGLTESGLAEADLQTNMAGTNRQRVERDPKKPWTWPMVTYQEQVLGVKAPWIGEISPMQFQYMSGRQQRAYDAKRSGEWDASSAAKGRWRDAVVAAYESGEIDPDTTPMSSDARDAIARYEREKVKAARVESRENALAENRINDISEVKPGDIVWHMAMGGPFEVVRVNKKSIGIKPVVKDEEEKANFRRRFQRDPDRQLRADFGPGVFMWGNHRDIYAQYEDLNKSCRTLLVVLPGGARP